MKPTFNQFHFLMSAMLFVSYKYDKDQYIHQLWGRYNYQNEQDPVKFCRTWHSDDSNYHPGIYIRNTFAANSWDEVSVK